MEAWHGNLDFFVKICGYKDIEEFYTLPQYKVSFLVSSDDSIKKLSHTYKCPTSQKFCIVEKKRIRDKRFFRLFNVLLTQFIYQQFTARVFGKLKMLLLCYLCENTHLQTIIFKNACINMPKH